MGKGGTKFCGVAISSRNGKTKTSYTNKELRRNMEKVLQTAPCQEHSPADREQFGEPGFAQLSQYLESGEHPDIQAAQRSREGMLPPLPDHDPNRPFVFMDLAVSNKAIGGLCAWLHGHGMFDTANSRACHAPMPWWWALALIGNSIPTLSQHDMITRGAKSSNWACQLHPMRHKVMH